MTRSRIKLFFPLTISLSVIIITYSVFAQRAFVNNGNEIKLNDSYKEQSIHSNKQVKTQPLHAQSEDKHLEQEMIIKLRLLEEFENDFLKQYTPPVGCEDWQNDTYMAKCINHQMKAKQEFKQEFIKKRGLPKDTFDYPKLS